MKTCPNCKGEFDDAKVAHIPLESSEARGMMTISFVTGCKELELNPPDIIVTPDDEKVGL